MDDNLNNDEAKKVPPFKKNNLFFKVLIITLIFITNISIGIIIEYHVFQRIHLSKQETIVIDDNVKEFIHSYRYIIDNYYEEVDERLLVESAIEGMVSSLGDEYSNLLNTSEDANLNTYLEGSFTGIGIQMMKASTNDMVILNIFENSPAEKTGLKVGDIILKIDDEDITEKDAKETNDIVKEKEGVFSMTIKRGEEEITFNIEKSEVEIKSVFAKKIENSIGYIRINIFALNTHEQLKKELDSLEKDKIKGLIIDLRDNSGGHLKAVEKMISLFLDESHVIYQTDTKGLIEKFYSNGKTTKKYPIVLLSNEHSASASEVMIGALRDEYGALLVGKTTFGKGTVQELNDLSDGGRYKITIKKWLTPKGVWVNEKGIIPDYEVDLSEEYYANPIETNDNQLKKAIELLK